MVEFSKDGKAKRRRGPEAGSKGAIRIAAAHKGSHEHDRTGGFASNPELAKEAGKKGGDEVLRKYGRDFLVQNGKKGGDKVKRERGREYYVKIGRRGGQERAANIKIKREGMSNTKV